VYASSESTLNERTRPGRLARQTLTRWTAALPSSPPSTVSHAAARPSGVNTTRWSVSASGSSTGSFVSFQSRVESVTVCGSP
jgi:hypothetical protein